MKLKIDNRADDEHTHLSRSNFYHKFVLNESSPINRFINEITIYIR